MVTERHAGFVLGEVGVCATCADEGRNTFYCARRRAMITEFGRLSSSLTLLLQDRAGGYHDGS